MPITIGVNENVFLESASIDDKTKVLNLNFEQLDPKAEAKPDNPFDLLASETVVETEFGMGIRIFPPLPPKEGNDRTEEKNIEMLVQDINKTKGILYHILKGYMTSDDLKGKLEPFRGIPINKENFNVQILKKEILEQVHHNLATDFMNQVKPFLGKKDQLFRLLLVRQSKDKHYATLRGRFLDENPFWESMAIPIEASKVAIKEADGTIKARFTKFELDNGLDNGRPADKNAAADKKEGTAGPAPVTAASVFGG